MAHAQKSNFVFRRNGRVHLNRRGRQFSRLLCSRGERISGSNAWYTMFRGSVKGTGYNSIRQFPLHFPSRASPCAITFQLKSTAFPSHAKSITDEKMCLLEHVTGPSPRSLGFILRAVNVTFSCTRSRPLRLFTGYCSLHPSVSLHQCSILVFSWPIVEVIYSASGSEFNP